MVMRSNGKMKQILGIKRNNYSFYVVALNNAKLIALKASSEINFKHSISAKSVTQSAILAHQIQIIVVSLVPKVISAI